MTDHRRSQVASKWRKELRTTRTDISVPGDEEARAFAEGAATAKRVFGKFSAMLTREKERRSRS